MHDDPWLRAAQILGRPAVSKAQAEANRKAGKYPNRPRAAVPGILPVSTATWWAGVRTGRFPPGTRLGKGIRVWRLSEVRGAIEKAHQAAP